MKIKTILATLIIFSSFVSSLIGQTPFEGEIKYLKTYNWTKMLKSLDYISDQRKDRSEYMWGKKSEWKEYKLLYIKSNTSKFIDSEEEAEDEPMKWSFRKSDFFVFNDYTNSTTTASVTFQEKSYIIKDSLATLLWKVGNNLKEIAGHLCMNATMHDTLRMQDVEAWFALDIPSSAGPSIYHGLPGLILEVDIAHGGTIISADSIQIKNIDKEIALPAKLKGKNITQTKYSEMLKKHIAERRKLEEPWFWGISL